MSETVREFEGLRVHSSGEGPLSLVLLHGFGASNHSWRRWIPTLRRRYRVHAIELAGFGSSPLPAVGDLSPRGQARRVGAFLERHPSGPLVLIGHSLGGAVATLVALDGEAGRLQIPLAGLALISAPLLPQRIPPILRAARVRGLGELFLLGCPLRGMIRTGLRQIVGRKALILPEMVTGYRAPLLNRERRRAILRAARQIQPEEVKALFPEYPRLTLPTLLLWGEQDRVVPPSTALRLRSTFPKSRCTILPGVGHLPAEEAPEESLAAFVHFLVEVESGSFPPAGSHPPFSQEGESHASSNPKRHPERSRDLG